MIKSKLQAKATTKSQKVLGRKEMFRRGCWSVELKPRNNHEGRKAWILLCEEEMFSLDENGVRRRGRLTEESVPPTVFEAAEKIFLKEQKRLLDLEESTA